MFDWRKFHHALQQTALDHKQQQLQRHRRDHGSDLLRWNYIWRLGDNTSIERLFVLDNV